MKAFKTKWFKKWADKNSIFPLEAL